MTTLLNIITWLRGLLSRKRPDVSTASEGPKPTQPK